MTLQPFNDEYFMRKALQQAEMAMSVGEVPIGAVVVSANSVIGTGHNLTETLNDVTAHAEMQAITAAANYLNAKYLNDCVLYVTIEPCVMCAGALAWSQIGRIVYGASDAKKGYTTYSDKILHPKTKVKSGVLEKECSQIVKDFFKKKR